MPNVNVQPVRTYASVAQVEKAIKKRGFQDLRYLIMIQPPEYTGYPYRYYPVFIGERVLQHGVHFHFNMVA